MISKGYLECSGTIARVPAIDVACKYCGSKNVIRWGHYHGIQRFYCKVCNRKFADNDALPNMQTPIDQVGAAIGMYYEGQSLNSVRRLLTQIYNSYPSDSTVYRWIARFTRHAVEQIKSYKPNVGDVWVADETVLDIDGKNVWFWDIIDAKTRYLLASHISRVRTIKDAQKLMELASERAGKMPKSVITDRLNAYLDGMELTFGADAEHRQGSPFDVENNSNLIERFHGTLKDRTKVMRGLKDIQSARLITDGWLLHYNFIRPHEALSGKTPASVSGIKYPYRNWQEIVAQKRVVTPSQTSTTSAVPIPMVDFIKLPVSRARIKPQRARLVKRLRHEVHPHMAIVGIRR